MKLRIYLDTSVISAYHDDRQPERQRETARFWNLIEQFDLSISDMTRTEIGNTQDEIRRDRMLASWNFKHLVNRRRRALINEVNILNGYPTIEIVAPPEI